MTTKQNNLSFQEQLRMEGCDKYAQALVETLGMAEKTGKGNYGSYAPLEVFTTIAKSVFAPKGIFFPQFVSGNCLVTLAVYKGAELFRSEMPLEMFLDAKRLGPQEAGKAFTYAKRYALSSIMGCCAGEEDDDAQTPQDVYDKSTRGASQVMAADPASEAQLKYVAKLLEGTYGTDKGAKEDHIFKVCGEKWGAMSKSGVSRVIQSLSERKGA